VEVERWIFPESGGRRFEDSLTDTTNLDLSSHDVEREYTEVRSMWEGHGSRG
jgi:hypothetical protein